MKEIYFSQFTFSNINRNTTLDPLEKNLILNTLDKKLFSHFLNENRIILSKDSVDCLNGRNIWLFNHANQVIFFEIAEIKENSSSHNLNKSKIIPTFICHKTNFTDSANKQLSPCSIIGKPGLFSIICKGDNNTYIYVKNILKRFSDNLEDEQKKFDAFHMEIKTIEEIEENFFTDLTFDFISIFSCNKLKRIHRNAFSITNYMTTGINIQHNPLLNSQDNPIFKILREFVNLKFITLVNNGISKLPSLAFKPSVKYQDNLINFNFANDKIELESFIFYNFHNLEKIRITCNELKQLKTDTFTMKPSRKYLTIDFSDPMFQKPKMNSSSFDVGSLTGINRPTKLVLATSAERHVLTYLDEEIFKPFLLDNSKNLIELNGKGIDCQDCRNIWIKDNPALLRKILNFKCANGEDIQNCKNFNNCSS